MDTCRNRPPVLLLLWLLCFLSTAALAQGGLSAGDAIYVDFGSGGNSTPGNWNNMTSTTGTITDAVTASGITTGIAFALPDRFNGVNENGTQAPDEALELPITATRDSFFGNDVDWSGLIEPTAQLVISGLDASSFYELTFFASRMSVGDNRQTQYAMTGADGLQQTLYLNVANNETLDVTSKAIRPTASGEIIVDIQKGPENDNSYGFYYLGAMTLQVSQNLSATRPNPVNGAVDVRRDVTLSWTSGQTAVTHDVYFGTDLDAVTNADTSNPMGVLVSQGQTESAYNPEGLLELGQTYYWRIDEVNSAPDFTVFKGEVWNFTAEPVAYAITDIVATASNSEPGSGPENTINGSGLNENDEHSIDAPDMWLAAPAPGEAVWIQYEFDRVYKLYELLVWNYNIQFEPVVGFGVKDVTIEYSTDGTEWATLGDAEFAQATASPNYTANTTVEFGGITARFVRLNVLSGYGMLGQYGLSEVRFTYIPVLAREPEPVDGAADVDPETDFSWRAGREAVSHDVYLGMDPEALALVDSTSETTTAADLEFGTTYYWKVDEVGDDTWAGDLWSFSTLEYALIDGFETYDDDVDAGTTIFNAWVDGWVNGNGSTVGYFDAPFAERTIVRTGAQSMPLEYNNSASPFYSEATRTFDSPQDWTGNGADSLVLYVQGIAPAFAETPDGIVMSAIGADIWGTADQGNFAYKSLSGDGSIVARVDSIYQSNDWAKGGVMIRETLDAGSTHALVAVTPVNGVAFQDRPAADGESFNVNQGGLTAPYWVKLTRAGNTFTAERSEDGVNWVSITDDAAASSVTIPMASNVYIGLALTSHDAAIATNAAFSNIATTGNVTGQWQTAAIGVAQPEGGNDPASLYVKIEDSSGKVAVAMNPDAAITVKGDWSEWRIPFSDLAGVNLSRVEAMTIGVGSPTNPTADGTGIIYIDDISYGKPAAE